MFPHPFWVVLVRKRRNENENKDGPYIHSEDLHPVGRTLILPLSVDDSYRLVLLFFSKLGIPKETRRYGRTWRMVTWRTTHSPFFAIDQSEQCILSYIKTDCSRGSVQRTDRTSGLYTTIIRRHHWVFIWTPTSLTDTETKTWTTR